ncbi:MAG: transposase [Chloroflexi bacterium]|nr:transposase [Chloroflexota bacterium]
MTTAILQLAQEFGRYGYRRVTGKLRAQGWSVNHKRVERILQLLEDWLDVNHRGLSRTAPGEGQLGTI